MSQNWNLWDGTNLKWQDTGLPWKNTALPWNNTSLPWKQNDAGGGPAPGTAGEPIGLLLLLTKAA